MIPLPSEISRRLSSLKTPNLSINYYKWCDIYERNNYGKMEIGKSENFLNNMVTYSKSAAYASAFTLRRESLKDLGLNFPLRTSSRLLFGIGYPSATEIGFMFDWTTGLPIIPGSSLKGVALSAAKLVLRGELEIETLSLSCKDVVEIFGAQKLDEEEKKDPALRCLDADDKDVGASAGEVVFLAAYPEIENEQNFLELDVMTPHYSPYYSDTSGRIPPADWFAPVPHLFLTVPRAIKYHFQLLFRRNLYVTTGELLTKTEQILKYALTNFGAGAKTNVGYGLFE